jgi:hypothetical protein
LLTIHLISSLALIGRCFTAFFLIERVIFSSQTILGKPRSESGDGYTGKFNFMHPPDTLLHACGHQSMRIAMGFRKFYFVAGFTVMLFTTNFTELTCFVMSPALVFCSSETTKPLN